MSISPSTLVSDIATVSPGTIKVFQRHRIDFCCGGKVSLAEACAHEKLDVDALTAELNASLQTSEPTTDWTRVPLAELVVHIQRRFHQPLNEEVPRLGSMLATVIRRHGSRVPDGLQETYDALAVDLLAHMRKEDAVLFPAIVALEAGEMPPGPFDWSWIDQPIAVMEAEHAEAGAALAKLAASTDNYTPPEDACPTWRGLYHGLSELEREMHEHVHLENHVLFPRAAALAGQQRSRS